MKKPFKSKYSKVQNPVLVAMTNAAPITDERNEAWRREENDAMDAMALRRGNNIHWSRLVRMANVAEVMAKAGIGIEVVPVAAEAQVVLAQVHERCRATGRWEMDMDEIHVMRELSEYHNLQRTAIPYGQFMQCFNRVVNIQKTGRVSTPKEILEQVNDLNAV